MYSHLLGNTCLPKFTPPVVGENSACSISFHKPGIINFFIFVRYNGIEMLSHYGFILIFLINKVEHHFVCLWVVGVPS